MDAIPLIRARYLQAFAAAAEQMGVHSSRLLNELGIPECVTEDSDTLHPAAQLFTFAALAAKLTGRADLGLEAGRTRLEDHGTFGAQVVESQTLHQALCSFCTEALKEYSRAYFWIEARGETTWFCREKIDGSTIERQQIELYLVELMLQTIRMVAGPHWQPQRLLLQSENEHGLRDANTLSRLNIQFGSPILAIPVPRRLLSQTLPRGFRVSEISVEDLQSAEPEQPATDFVESLRQMLPLYHTTGHPHIETAAEIAGISVRTLQRRLESAGQSYSQVVDEVRMQGALPMLQDPCIPIADIASAVGYSQPGHFTRAFRRWAGVSPSEYRSDLET